MNRPILDTHIHLYQVSRAGGVPWPPAHNVLLYRDTLPADYKAEALPLGIVGAGIVEASPLPADTGWMLAQIAADRFFSFYVAQLPIGAPSFEQELAALAAEERVVGVRAFLWNPPLTLDAQQIGHLGALAELGMTLDLISRGSFNPKEKILGMADAVPNLRIIVDHLGGAKGGPIDPGWAADMQRLAQRRNVHLKLSAPFDMWNPAADDNQPWTAPKDPAAYAPHFDVVLDAFGADRVIFGSNWPVCNLAGTLAEEIQLLERYLAPRGTTIRDQVMYENARAFYRRI